MDTERLNKCRSKLVEVAAARSRITYGELAAHLGVANQSVGPYLNSIYREEVTAERPDLTLVVVYADTGFGRYNSGGGPAQSVKVDPQNLDDVKAYNEHLARVYPPRWIQSIG
jgi:hypothetical protein